jgi:hypothetical protein
VRVLAQALPTLRDITKENGSPALTGQASDDVPYRRRTQLRVSLRINDNETDASIFCIAFAFTTCNIYIPGEVLASLKPGLVEPHYI